VRRKVTKTEKRYKEDVKLLRQYFNNFGPKNIDLRKHLSPQQKAKITRYSEDLSEIISGSFRKVPIYRYKTKKKKRKIQESVHQGAYYSPHLKYALVPVPSPKSEPKIEIHRDGSVVVSDSGVYRTYVNFNFDDLVMDRYNRIQEILDQFSNVRSWFISAGNHEIHRSPEAVNMPPDADHINFVLERLMEQYGADKYDPENPSSHFYGNWLNGLIGYRFDNQKDFKAYQRSKRLTRQAREDLRDRIKKNKKAMRIMQNLSAKGVPMDQIEETLRQQGYIK